MEPRSRCDGAPPFVGYSQLSIANARSLCSYGVMLRDFTNQFMDAFRKAWAIAFDSWAKTTKTLLISALAALLSFFILGDSDGLSATAKASIGLLAIIAFFFAALAYYLLWPHFYARCLRRQMINLWLYLAALTGAFTIAFIAAYFLDRARGPVLWNWSRSAPISTDYDTLTGPLRVDGFQITGRNRSPDLIQMRRAFIESSTGFVAQMDFTQYGRPFAGAVQTGEKFEAIYRLESEVPGKNTGVHQQRFLQLFPAFRLVVEHSGGTYTRFFSGTAIVSMLVDADAQHRRDYELMAKNRIP